MNPFDQNTWEHQWSVFWTAPFIYFPLLVSVLVIGWWIGKKLAGAQIDGLNGTIGRLNATITSLNARNEVAEERLKYLKEVNEREEDVRRANIKLEKERDELNRQIAANASKETIVYVAHRVVIEITNVSTANNALADALKALNLTVGSPQIGSPTFTATGRSE